MQFKVKSLEIKGGKEVFIINAEDFASYRIVDRSGLSFKELHEYYMMALENEVGRISN